MKKMGRLTRPSKPRKDLRYIHTQRVSSIASQGNRSEDAPEPRPLRLVSLQTKDTPHHGVAREPEVEVEESLELRVEEEVRSRVLTSREEKGGRTGAGTQWGG